MPKATEKTKHLDMPEESEQTHVMSDPKYHWYSEQFTLERQAALSTSNPALSYKDLVQKIDQRVKNFTFCINKVKEDLKQNLVEKRALKSELSAERQLRKKAEDERDTLKQEISCLKKDLDNVTNKQKAEIQTFNVVIQQTKLAYEQVVCQREELSHSYQDSLTKLQLSLHDCETEKQRLEHEMENLRRSHQDDLFKIKLESAGLEEKTAQLVLHMKKRDEKEQTLMVQVSQMKLQIEQMRQQEVIKNMNMQEEKMTLMTTIKDLKDAMQEKEAKLSTTVYLVLQKEKENRALEDRVAAVSMKMDQMKAEHAQRSTAWLEEKRSVEQELGREKQERSTAEESLNRIVEENLQLVEKVRVLEKKKNKWYRRLFKRST